MALANQWDYVRGGYEGLKMGELAKKCGCLVGVRNDLLITSSKLSFRILPLLDAWRSRR